MDSGQNRVEYVVKREPDAVLRLRKALIITACFGPAAALGMALLNSAAFAAPLPLLIAGVCARYFWRYTSLEYEYTVAGGIFTVSAIYGGRARKDLLELAVSDMMRIAPYGAEYYGEYTKSVKTANFYTSGKHAPDPYFFIYTRKNGANGMVVFDAAEKMIKLMRNSNPRNTVVKRGFKA